MIHVAQEERRVAILANNKLDDYFIELDRHQSMVGNIYKGKVESILPSINGAFVNIGQERNGFLYLTDADNPLREDLDIDEEEFGPRKILKKLFKKKEEPAAKSPPPRRRSKSRNEQMSLKEGEEIMVQVVKDPFGTKGARLTTHISLPGRFIVYMPLDSHTGISKKISDVEERKRLREVMKEFDFVKTGGFIVRTVSKNENKRDLVRDAKFLYTKWQKIVKYSKEKDAPALIYKEGALVWKVVRDFVKNDVKRILIDDPDEFEKLKKYVETYIGRRAVKKVQLHQGKSNLFEAHKIGREIEKIYDKQVHMRSGAYVVIEPTEGVVVVDVNSGRFKFKGSPEEAACKVNVEAAVEIARQLRLRDLGGIIVIDFIDMQKGENRRKVVETLKRELAKDQSKTEVYPISQLGLVEMTRARAGRTIDAIKFTDCPYCDGRGRVRID